MADTVQVEVFVDVLCPYSLLAVRRVREAVAEHEGAAMLALRALPLVTDVDRIEKALGSRERARLALARRLTEASQLNGGENLVVGADALQHGRLLLVSSLPPLAAVKWAQAEHGELPATRLFLELASRYLEHGEDVGELRVLAASAAEVGLDPVAMLGALELGTPGAALARDRNAARSLGLRATPVVLLDGRVRLDGLSGADEYREAIGLRLASRSSWRNAGQGAEPA